MAPFVLACSAEPGLGDNSAGTGGFTGGAVGTGGTTNPTTGGSPATGGATSTGGSTTTNTGGSNTSTTGGSVGNTGGSTSNTGGSTSNTGGSTSNTGGSTSNTGGAVSTGGSTTSGGMGGGSSTGGTQNTGGSKSTGGSSTGGSGTGGSGTGGASTMKFSFFVTSYAALTRLSGSADGFGGDLRYGETGTDAGLKGADKICSEIAEKAVPGAGAKGWRAFLSTPTVNAIDRIGDGPWYDRLGRLFSASKANLSGFRPSDADAAIKNDFPNEYGTNNHDPDGTGKVDNHDSLTGSGDDGKLYKGANNPTCDGWTTKTGSAGKPRVGHSWPRSPSANNTCTGGGGFPGGGGATVANSGCYGHWMSSLDEAGCGAGVNLVEMGGPIASIPTVGSGGGYGGFYCFALTP